MITKLKEMLHDLRTKKLKKKPSSSQYQESNKKLYDGTTKKVFVQNFHQCYKGCEGNFDMTQLNRFFQKQGQDKPRSRGDNETRWETLEASRNTNYLQKNLQSVPER